MFRYSFDNKEYEQFVHFENIFQDRTAYRFYTFVNNIVQKYECEHKIVSQTNDDAAVLDEETKISQCKVFFMTLNGLSTFFS